MMSDQKNIKVFLLTVFFLTNVFFYGVYLYDPLHLYHKPYLQKPLHLRGKMRQEAAGIIRHDDFDSILMGSSIFLDFSAIDASKTIGGDFVNLSIADGDFFERSVILTYALQRKPIKRIIGSLDGPNNGVRFGGKQYPLDQWAFLYDHNPLNDIQAYLNDKYLRCLLLLSDHADCIGTPIYQNDDITWVAKKPDLSNYGHGIEHWEHRMDNESMRIRIKQIITYSNFTQMDLQKQQKINTMYRPAQQNQMPAIIAHIESTLLTMVQKYPQTSFDFFDYPFSRLYFACLAQANRVGFEKYAQILAFVVAQSEKHANLTIYGLNESDFLDDLKNYKDLIHFHPRFTRNMIESIAENKNILTMLNLPNYLQQVEKKALHYDLVSDGKKAQIMMQNYKNKTFE